MVQTSFNFDKPAGVWFGFLLDPEIEVAFDVVGDAGGDEKERQNKEKQNIEGSGQTRGRVWVRGWTRVEAATGPRSLAVGWGPALVTVTVSQTVTLAVAITIVDT